MPRRLPARLDPQNNPQRTASAASQTSPARQSPQNTAADPKSLILPMAMWCSGVT